MSKSYDGVPTGQALLVGLDRWLRLRWWLAPAELVAIVAAGPIPPRAPLWLLAILLAFAPLPGMLASRLRHRQSSRALLGGFILADLVLLTAALAFCGGTSNPFSVLYLVYVTLACVLLGPGYGWAGTAVAAGLYGFLFLLTPYTDPHAAHVHGSESALQRHLWSMYFAFVAVSVLVVSFVSSVTRVLRNREADLAEAKDRAERNERLANVMVLAAGTAHEIGTPLATIAVTAKEMERAAVTLEQTSLIEDARLIRGEVERCRRLLEQLRGQAGAVEGEAPVAMKLDEAVLAAISELPERARPQVTIACQAHGIGLLLPRVAFVRVLSNVLRNALEASRPGGPIVVDASTHERSITVSVTDEGRGMDQKTVDRAREPFFTTKPTGTGLGLGLFLADRFARDVGGSLLLESHPGRGTQVRFVFPA
jgi:two-component system, sensor histidine kinase RegB